jgi:hypothetical protein
MFAVRAKDHKFRPFISSAADNFYERLACRDPNSPSGLVRQGKLIDLLTQRFLDAWRELSGDPFISVADVKQAERCTRLAHDLNRAPQRNLCAR